MFAINRRRFVALLLIVMISYTAFSVHVSMHAPGDHQTKCQLCTGNGNPPHAPPAPANTAPAPAVFVFTIESEPATHSASPLVLYRQRAPPFIA